MNTPKTITVTESQQLLDCLLSKKNSISDMRISLRNYCIGLLMLDAGLRVGEVVSLIISDLFYAGKPVENLTIRAEISKNKTERIIPLSSRLREALALLLLNMPNAGVIQSTRYAFFTREFDKPMTTRQVERIIRAAANRSIGRPIHPHMLRHTFASRLMRKTDARTVQEVLGHKQMSSTQIYCHTNLDETKKAIDKLNDDFNYKTTPLLF